MDEKLNELTKQQLIEEIRKYGGEVNMKNTRAEMLSILKGLPVDPEKIGKPYVKLEDIPELTQHTEKGVTIKKVKSLTFVYDTIDSEMNAVLITDINDEFYHFTL